MEGFQQRLAGALRSYRQLHDAARARRKTSDMELLLLLLHFGTPMYLVDFDVG